MDRTIVVSGLSGLLVLVAVTGCKNTVPVDTDRTFRPGERAVKRGPLRMELMSAHYAERQVQLRVRLKNTGEAPVEIERKGILLAYDNLEYPVAAATAPRLPVPATLVVPPRGEVEYELPFFLGQGFGDHGELLLRSIRRRGGSTPGTGDSTWLDTVSLGVPGAPPPAAPASSAEGKTRKR